MSDPTGSPDAVDQLRELSAAEVRAKETVAACDRRQSELEEELRQAQRAFDVARAGGVLEPGEGIAARLVAAKANLAACQSERDEANAELKRLSDDRITLVKSGIRPVWTRYCRQLAKQYEEGTRLAEDVGKRVAKFRQAVDATIEAKATFDALVARFGPHKQRILDDLRETTTDPGPPEPDELRQLWDQACALLRIFERNC